MNKFTGLEYLKIAIANAYGLDKELWKTRIKWTENHIDNLEDMVSTADSPMQYTKAVTALRDTQANKPTGYIMGLDACASGYQIMGCLTGCRATLQRTNVINTGNREDLYTFINDKMIKNTGITYDRKEVKKTIMTTAYGSIKQPEALYGRKTSELEMFWNVMDYEVTGAMQLMEIIQGLWNSDATEYQWTLPDGHIVVMQVTDTMEHKIEVDELDHATFTHTATIVKAKKKGLALTANVVHSIDAWIVREMVRRCTKKNVQLAPIHDAFYASPNDMQVVRETYRNILAELSSLNIMQTILNELGGQHIQYKKFEQNLHKDIMNSDYALS